MQFDDRLATVLRSPPGSDAAMRTQFRQLLDLLGSAADQSDNSALAAAFDRLDALTRAIPGVLQSKIIREPGLRLRNPALIAHLARGEPLAAAAVMATARLDDAAWRQLIPRLPLVARGFLRHRRDLPPGAQAALKRLGVTDLVLPMPAPADGADALANASLSPPQDDAASGIARLVRRIEEFQKARQAGPASPRLPLAEMTEADPGASLRTCDLTIDGTGMVTAADAPLAPLLVGLALLAGGGNGPLADPAALRLVRQRQPLRNVAVELEGPPIVAGLWRLDAAPAFRPADGSFAGYHARLRRPAPPAPPVVAVNPEAERMRQVLHELRTPVNAIQGFAEIIQQQLFAPVPNEYRALAAGIAVDAARLLAGFEEIDRLARLESGALDLPQGSCDLHLVTLDLLRRLDGVLRPRSAAIACHVEGDRFAVPRDAADAQLLVWRMLATLAGSLAPGETIRLEIMGSEDRVSLTAQVPQSLEQEADLFAAAAPAQARALSAGMFGTGFALRLARAEAEAAGGGLERNDGLLTLWLPVPMQDAVTESGGDRAEGGMSAA
jgi:hypothetical protein